MQTGNSSSVPMRKDSFFDVIESATEKIAGVWLRTVVLTVIFGEL